MHIVHELFMNFRRVLYSIRVFWQYVVHFKKFCIITWSETDYNYKHSKLYHMGVTTDDCESLLWYSELTLYTARIFFK